VARPLVCIVILNWNNCEDTLRCIRSVREQTYDRRRVLVIDNGSTDGSAERLAALGDEVELIALAENTGYAGGNNIAFAHAFTSTPARAAADYAWLLNNDAVAEPDTLARLVETAEAAADIGLASPLVRAHPDAPAAEFNGGRIDLTIPTYLMTGDVALAREWQASQPGQVVLHGTALLVRRALWERIGGFDETLFAYWEDVDYSIRSGLAGFRNVADFDTAIVHAAKPTMTAPETIRPHVFYYVARNEMLMWRRYAHGTRWLKTTLWCSVRQLRLLARPGFPAAGAEAILAGLWDGWRGVGGPYDPNRRAPWWLRRTLGRYPGSVINLLEGKLPWQRRRT
jgi:GT2 family glycosyltransferase